MKKLFVVISAALLTCGIIAAPAFADETAPVFETKAEAQAALDDAKSDIPDGTEVVKEEVVKLDDKVVTDKEAYDETIEHPEVTHEETVIDQEAYDEVVEHPAITHEVTVVDTPAWDEQVCTPGTDPYGYKVDGDNRDGFTVEDGAFVLIKQASEYVIIWSEDAEFSDYPTAKEIAAAANDGSVKNQQVVKWKGLGEFYPGNLGKPWHHWYGFCKNSEGIYFWVDNINGISHADVYVPGKPGECKTVHHDAVTHQETVVDQEAWEETWHHGRILHYETVVDEEAWTEIVHHDAVTHNVEQWTYVVEFEYIDVPVYVQEVSVASVLPKTGDTFGDVDSIIAIITAICLAIIILSCSYKIEHKE